MTFLKHTALSATVASIPALTLELQKYSSYEKLMRVVVHALGLLSKNEAYRSISGSITDPQELEYAQRSLFYLVPQSLSLQRRV